MKDDIKEMIRNGSYFKDAMDWYSTKYIFPFTLRSSMLALSAILIIGVLISVNAAKTNFFSLKIPFPIYAKDQVNFFSKIKSLNYKNESIEVSVARYFITKYIELREGYNFINFLGENKELIFNKIKALSSQQVYRGYEEYISPDENTESPIIVYKNQVTRLIKVNDINIITFNGYPESAIVKFTVTEKSRVGSKDANYEAKLSFLMSDTIKVLRKFEPLYFIVNKYRTYELSK